MNTALTVSTSEVLGHYDGMADAQIVRYGTGLINETYLVTATSGDRFILQCMNAVIGPAVNLDIEALTRHLESLGEPTQRLVPASDGALWVSIEDRTWRLSTFVPGVCFDRLHEPRQVHEAGALLGRFHRNVSTLALELHSDRPCVHDTARHLNGLEQALDEHATHPYYEQIAPLAEEVLRAAADLPLLSGLPDRLVHGDPKISNLVFDEATGVGLCMIDLDTLTYMALPLEMGDAIRSWCNPKGEDETQAQFRLDYFTAAIEGYATEAATLLEPVEWQSFVTAANTIMVELAARFTRDALREQYFGWNPDKFPDRSTHNRIRAIGQLNLHRSFSTQLAAAEDVVARVFA